MKRIWLLAIVASLGLAAAACGSSSTTGASTASGTSDAPIHVMTMIPINSQFVSFPEAKVAAEARVKAINAAGGIAGHQVILDVCDTKADPNVEPACIRQAVANNDVAIVGALTIVPATYTVLQSTDIPLIGGWAILPQDFTTRNVYQYTSGVPGWYGGIAAIAHQLGVKTIGIVECDSPACAGAAQTVTTYGKMAGIQTISTQTAPVSVPDVTAVVAKVANAHPGAVVLAVTTAQVPPVLTALQQDGYKGKVITDVGALNTDAMKAAGSAANGVYLTSQVELPTGTPDAGVAQYMSEMKAQDPTAPLDDQAEEIWGSFYLFQQLGKTLPTGTAITAQTITNALNNIKTPLSTGVAAPFTTANKSPIASAPRLFSTAVYTYQIEGGSLVPYGDGSINFLKVLGQ